ncbi:MAG TPA: phosphoglucosamine mutase [Desulfurococcales archaeon]|nr:phosphoglucosamine mutase [Desulfurococcales archaeon]
MGKLFGTDGVRGIVNRDLTVDLALKLGLAIGTYFGEGAKVLIGRDVRFGGEMLKYAVISGLLSAGVKVYDAGLVPTPCLQYNVKTENFDGGIMITASHNPPEYNGIKVIGSNGVEIPRSAEREIEEILFESRFKYTTWGNVVDEVHKYPNAIEKYVNGVLEHIDTDRVKSKRFNIVVDSANSVGILPVTLLARRLNVRVIAVNSNLDGAFPGREPEPTVSSLQETARIVKSLGADFGVGFDGDADRAIFIDDEGRIHWGDRSAAILCRYLIDKEGRRGRVYTAVSSSILVEEYLKPYGVEIVWLKVGSVDIAHAMLRDPNVLCGFEENGGFMYPKHQYVRDATMTLALMLELLSYDGRRLAEIFNELPQYIPLKTKIPMKREDAEKVIETLKERYKGQRIITIDGVKIMFKDSWILVRPSGTEPVLRIMAEAKSEERLKELISEVKNIINEVLGK